MLWSPLKNAFVYTNNLTVTFPPDRVPSSKPPSRVPSRAQSPEDSQDGDRRPSRNAATVGKVSRQEKDCCFKEKLCFYYSKPGHQVRDCQVKKSQLGLGRKPGQRRDTRTWLLTTEETEPQEEGGPTDYDNSNISLSRF